MSCETPISWYDNVPVVSYALLRGRCRRCGVHIPPRDLAIVSPFRGTALCGSRAISMGLHEETRCRSLASWYA